MEDIFREIDEDLRADKLKKLWQRYQWLVYIAVGLLLLAVAGYSWWQHREREARAAEGARYAEAIALVERGDTTQADKVLDELARSAGQGYATLARLYEAAVLANKGDIDGAVQRYDQVAADGGTDKLLRDLATLLAVSHRIDHEEPAKAIERLKPLLAEDNPWRFSARELTGVAMLRAGDAAGARGEFTRLADDAAAPPGIRARAAELLKTLGP